MLASRTIAPADFITDFYATILPGLIPQAEFIHWGQLNAALDQYNTEIERLTSLARTVPPKQALHDFISQSHAPLLSLKLLFRLVGHTGEVYVSSTNRIDIKATAKAITIKENGYEEILTGVVDILLEIGIDAVLGRAIPDILLGVGIGLETHRRKNGGGTAFKNVVGSFLADCLPLLQQIEPTCILKSEVSILYENGRQSKNVDFAYCINDKPVIGFEVNFYTSTGSKPSEIKRSYNQVRRDLEAVGTQLVWVTDGEGYMRMRKSLTDAQETHPNIYNFSMLKRYIISDILGYLAT